MNASRGSPAKTSFNYDVSYRTVRWTQSTVQLVMHSVWTEFKCKEISKEYASQNEKHRTYAFFMKIASARTYVWTDVISVLDVVRRRKQLGCALRVRRRLVDANTGRRDGACRCACTCYASRRMALSSIGRSWYCCSSDTKILLSYCNTAI